MTFLVTGAGGQLGECFKEIQEENPLRDYKFVSREEFDISRESDYANLKGYGLEGIINCAAYTHVDGAEEERDKAERINAKGPERLARWCRENEKFLIHISTDYVYGAGFEPLEEDHAISPVNWYGHTKWKGEEAVRETLPAHLILRTAWLYSHQGHNFVRTMLRLGKERDLIRVVDDQRGSPTYAVDLAQAVDHILHSGSIDRSAWGTYNFTNQGSVTWFDFAKKILESESDVTVEPISTREFPTPAARPAYSVLDSQRFMEKFDYKIPDWEEALERCLTRINLKSGNSE